MKKLIAILMVLLCAFSLSADWGRIRYVDEFGDANPNDSDPYQIVYGTKYEYGVTERNYRFRLLTGIPFAFDGYCTADITIFDPYGNIVVFPDGGEAVVRVKLASDEIIELTCELEDYAEGLYFFGNDIATLMNELYKGNDLKFVIYYDDARYNFTIDAFGYKELADEFLTDNDVPESPDITDRQTYRGITSYIPLSAGNVELVLEMISDGIPGHDEYPYFFTAMLYKHDTDAFWSDNNGEFPISSVSLIAPDGTELSLDEEISENRLFFDFWEGDENAEVLKFAEGYESLTLLMEIEPSYEFRIPISKDDLLKFLTFSDL